jgi:hypothetical protein
MLVTVSCKVDGTRQRLFTAISNPLRGQTKCTHNERVRKRHRNHLSAAAHETEKATATAPGLIVLIHAATRNVPTVVYSHAIRAALACRRCRSLLSPFRCAAVQKRVRVRRSIPVGQRERARRTSYGKCTFWAMRCGSLDTVPVGTRTEYAWRRCDSVRVDVRGTIRRLAWT